MYISKVTGIGLCIFVAASLLLPGCASQPPAPPGSVASLSEPVICSSFDQTNGPSQLKSTFAPKAPWIICSFKITTATSGTMIKSVWQYPDGSLSEQEKDTSGTGYRSFEIKPRRIKIGSTSSYRTEDFPVGDYTVKLFLNGNEEASLKFKVQ